MDFKSREEILNERLSSRQDSRMKAHNAVKSLVRKFHFNNLVASGMAPVDAARRLGVKLPFGRRIQPADILKKLDELKK